jgi:hypothetical protein
MKSTPVVISITLLCAWMASGCQRTPQLGGQRECMTAADALWTAVNVKQSDLLDRSEVEIKRLHAAGEMPSDAYESLVRIIATARNDQWSDARAALKSFLRDQRPLARR